MATTKRQRRHHRDVVDDRFKMHLHLVDIGPTTYRLITLRPGTRAAFSTNYYHRTWHVVTDGPGAGLLARSLWGLSYQRRLGTMVLLHGEHIQPTPFDAARSDPILLIPSHLTTLNEQTFRQIKMRLDRLGAPTKTVRRHTFGLDRALETDKRFWETVDQLMQQGLPFPNRDSIADPQDHVYWEGRSLMRNDRNDLWRQEQMVKCGGFICYSAPPPILRYQAQNVHRLMPHVAEGRDMDYHFLAEVCPRGDGNMDGEVQVFQNYRQQLFAAGQARREVLACSYPPSDPETLETVISNRRDEILKRLG